VSHNPSIPHRLIGQDAPPAPSLVRATFTVLWTPINGFLEWFGELGLFSWQVLRAALRRLPEADQGLLVLLYRDLLNLKQASARLGIPVTSTGPARGRCLDKLCGDPAVAALTSAGTAPREMPGRALAQ